MHPQCFVLRICSSLSIGIVVVTLSEFFAFGDESGKPFFQQQQVHIFTLQENSHKRPASVLVLELVIHLLRNQSLSQELSGLEGEGIFCALLGAHVRRLHIGEVEAVARGCRRSEGGVQLDAVSGMDGSHVS